MLESKQEINFYSKYEFFAKKFFGFFLLLIAIFGVLGQILGKDERDVLKTNCREYNPEWFQVLDDGTKISVTAPTIIDAEYGEVITLTTTLPDNLQDGECICFRPVWQDVTIYVDGEVRVSYNTTDSRPFGKNSPMRYIFTELSSSDSGKALTYRFSSYSKYAGDIREGYIGDRLSIWLHLLEANGTHMFITIFLLLMSIFCIIVCQVLKYVYKMSLPLNYLACTLFLCAFWMMSEFSFRQIMFKNISILSYFTYWCLMIIPIPLISFVNEIQNFRYRKIFMFPLTYSVILTIVGTILQVFNIVEFVSQLKLIHGGLLVSIIIVMGTITLDTFKGHLKEYLFVGIGVYGMILTAVAEMALYYIGTSLSLGTVLSIGLVFLLLMAIFKTAQDLLTSEKKKQQAIVAREEQAKFLANMSHEIRTPINAIVGMNEMILRENKDEQITEYATNIKSASNMLVGLVSDILDFSKIESGQLDLVEENYNLARLINDEMLLLQVRSAEKPITTKLDMDPGLPMKLFGDELRVKQILTNLISNAAKYTNEGNITLKVSKKEIDEDNIELSFSVTDTGIGIKEDELTQVFDSFKRLELNKNRGIQGSGLGLNIARDLAMLMGGNITVVSEYGKGSTFTVTIPQRIIDKTPIISLDNALKKDKYEQKSSSTNAYTAPDASILIVDDNSMNLTLMGALLKRTNIKLDLVESGRDALTACQSKKYDIIFMDHMMPEMDGIETLQQLRKEPGPNQDSVVIALTANAVAGCREMYLEHGFNDYFAKPVVAAKLDELILNYLPKELVIMNNIESTKIYNNSATNDDNTAIAQTSSSSLDEYLIINKENGLKFCMDSEEFYNEILGAFCSQAEKFIPQLAEYYDKKDWSNYAIIAHSLKSNTRTIGADNFADLSYKHELAGKADDSDYITENYELYIAALKALMDKVKGMV